MASGQAWQRRYVASATGGAITLIIIGTAFLFVGVLVAVAGAFAWASGGDPLFMMVGALFALVGPGLLVGAWYQFQRGKSRSIVCGPEGFSVFTESRSAGRTEERYSWNEVTATTYNEEMTRDAQNENSTRVQYFSVKTAGGPAFTVTRSVSRFNDLIGVVNHMTPHLPYTWVPRPGFSITIGPVSAERFAFVQVPREATLPAPPTAGVGDRAAVGRSIVAPPQTAESDGGNFFGLLGLILSIASLFTCGLFSPLGLVVSLVGLSRPNKGLSIAGALVGLVGCVILVAGAVWTAQGFAKAHRILQVDSRLDEAAQIIRGQREKSGTLPDEAEGRALVGGTVKPGDEPLQYKPLGDDRFELRWAGFDGVVNTRDDIAREFAGVDEPDP